VTSLDGALAWDFGTQSLIAQLFCGLVELSPQLDVMPDVAQSWEVLDGGARYVFHLRDDVTWSDGVPVTAGDFEYAWKRRLDPATGSPEANQLYVIRGARAFHRGQGVRDQVGVNAIDEGTLVVELERPTGYYLQLLATTDAFPVPRHAVEMHGESWTEPSKIVSNGPFRLESWQPGESLVLVRNPTYHGRFTGNLERVELTQSTDEITRVPLEMYEAGSLDCVGLWRVPMRERESFRQSHADEILFTPQLVTCYVLLFPAEPPLDDVRVRRALVLATDRDSLSDVVWGGTDVPATGGLVPQGMPGHSPGIGLPYDPKGARQLLAEAGYAGGRAFPPMVVFSARWYWEEALKNLQAQWLENLGVQTTWQIVDPVDYADWSRTPRREHPHLSLGGWNADYPDPDNFLRVTIEGLRRRWDNLAYERLIEEASRLTDQAERMALYRQADRMLIEEAVVMPITYGRLHLLVKPWVARYALSPMRNASYKDVILEPH
jgi:oligopeptide transport system substrate-binding protein